MLRARVVSRREEARVALTVTTFAASVLLLVLLDDLLKVRVFPGPGDFVYTFVAAMIALAGIGPWIAWTLRGDAVQVMLAAGKVVAGETVLTADDVKGVAVAQGARGRSVAVSSGDRGRMTFLEVERDEDAEEILQALGQKRAASATLPLQMPSRLLALWQGMLSWVCLACAPLYWMAAMGHMDGNGKGTFGVTGVLAALASAGFLALRQLLKKQAVAVRRGAYDAHVALHADAPVEAPKPADAGVDAKPSAAPEARTASALARGNEPVRAWLARLDALPNEAHAYRGDAMKKDVLWDTLSDDAAPLETRMGAARVLARRHGEEGRALVRVVEDPDVKVRVEAALEEEEEVAERRIERLGPLFRAR